MCTFVLQATGKPEVIVIDDDEPYHYVDDKTEFSKWEEPSKIAAYGEVNSTLSLSLFKRASKSPKQQSRLTEAGKSLSLGVGCNINSLS